MGNETLMVDPSFFWLMQKGKSQARGCRGAKMRVSTLSFTQIESQSQLLPVAVMYKLGVNLV